MSEIELSPASVEAVARRVAELLEPRPGPPALIDVAEAARRLGVKPLWVYEHADELGVVRLAKGSRPRLRFDPDTISEWLEAQHEAAATRPLSHGTTSTDSVPVLAVRRR